MQRHKMKITPGMGAHAIHVDGHDLSRGVRTVRLTLEPGDAPHVELEMAIIEMDPVEFETPNLYIPDATRDALVALGWTPPASDEPPAVVLPARPQMESVVHMYGKPYEIVAWDCYGTGEGGYSSISLRVVPSRKQGRDA